MKTAREQNSGVLRPLCLSAADVGRLLSISPRQVYAMHTNGILGPVPVSLSERLTRWDRAEIEAWWAATRAAGRPIARAEWLRQQKTEGP